jgi:hypothetical protein
MSDKPRPGGNWDRQDLTVAIRANERLRVCLREIADELPRALRVQALLREAALTLAEQQQALRDMQVRWLDWRKT